MQENEGKKESYFLENWNVEPTQNCEKRTRRSISHTIRIDFFHTRMKYEIEVEVLDKYQLCQGLT